MASPYTVLLLTVLLCHDTHSQILNYTLDSKTRRVIGRHGVAIGVINDYFMLNCAAPKTNYVSVQFTFSSSAGKETQAPAIKKEDTDALWQRAVDGPVTEDYNGTFTCTANAASGPWIKSIRIKVEDEEGVRFLEGTNMCPYHNITGCSLCVSGDYPFTFICSVSGTPRPSFTWMKDNSAIIPNNVTQLRHFGAQLVIKAPNEEHSGEYSCVARNRINEVRGHLTLRVPGDLEDCNSAGLSEVAAGLLLSTTLLLSIV